MRRKESWKTLILINSALRRVLYFSTSRNLSVLSYVTGASLLRQVNSPVNSTCCTFSERDLTHCHNIFFFGFLTGFNKRKNATYIFLKKNACNFSSDKFSLRWAWEEKLRRKVKKEENIVNLLKTWRSLIIGWLHFKILNLHLI